MNSRNFSLLSALVLERDMEKVTGGLLKLGVLHMVKSEEFTRGWDNAVKQVSVKVQHTRTREVISQLEGILELGGYRAAGLRELDISRRVSVDLERSAAGVESIWKEVQAVRDRQEVLQKEILKLSDMRRQLEMFGDIQAGIQSSSQFSFLDIKPGSLSPRSYEAFKNEFRSLPSVQLELSSSRDTVQVLLISMKRDQNTVADIKKKYVWQDTVLPDEIKGMTGEAVTTLDEKLKKLKADQKRLGDETGALVEKRKDSLLDEWEVLRLNELYLRVQSCFGHTSRTVLFYGWVPEQKRDDVDSTIRELSGGNCFLEWSDAAEAKVPGTIQPPVVLNNPAWLSPFQMLVKNFSIPRYGTIDPTPAVAVAYLAMFGLMFGDVGHGLVLLVLGLAGRRYLDFRSEGTRDLLGLVSWCGVSAMIFGVLFGSYFGFKWFPPLWFDFHDIIAGHAPADGTVKDIYGILLVSIWFGIAVIGLGLILNLINSLGRRDWLNLCFDKGGLIGAWFYAVGIYLAFGFARGGFNSLPEGSNASLLVGLPVLVLGIKPPLEFILHHKKFTFLTPVDLIMEWIVELMEIFTGFLANTLSFMRVAGLGIAHVCLMIAFYEIAMLAATDSGFSVFSVIILVLGNILVIALEGLSAGIQSLRLNYYEFFSKFFSGSGMAYAPVSLKIKK